MTEMTDRTRDAGAEPAAQPAPGRLPATRQPQQPAPHQRQRHKLGEYWDLDRCGWVPWPATD